MSEESSLLKSTLDGLQKTSKGQLRQDFILHGKSPEEQIAILDEGSEVLWSPQIEEWLRKRDSQQLEISTSEEWMKDKADGVGSHLVEEQHDDDSFKEEAEIFFEQNRSVVEEVTIEIQEYESTLDDELLSESRKRVKDVLLTIQPEKPSKLEVEIVDKEQEPNQLRQVLERNQKLGNFWLLQAQQCRQKYIEECRLERELTKAAIANGEQESKRLQEELLMKRRQQLQDECVVLIQDLEAMLKSCLHVQFLRPDVRDQSQTTLKVLYHIAKELKSKISLGEQQVTVFASRFQSVRVFLMEKVNPAIQEANAAGLQEEKLRLDREKMEQEKQRIEKKLEQEKIKREQMQREQLQKEQLARVTKDKDFSSAVLQKGMDAPSSSSLDSSKSSATNKDQVKIQSKMSIPESAIINYMSLQEKLGQVSSKNSLLTATDTSTKQYRFQLQKTIGLTVNGLSTNNGEVLMERISRIKDLLKGKTLSTVGKQVSTSKHPGATLYCCNLLALKLVKQGQDEVSSNPSAAFPLAAMIISLFSNFSDLGELILAHLYSQCPVLVPLYIKQNSGMAKVDSLKLQGYKVSSDGVLETDDEFLRRMCGMVKLYAAVISSPQLPIEQGPHPHGPQHGWAWLARILNMEPHPILTAGVLGSFLEIAGHALMRCYGQQFKKLLNVLYKDYMPKLEKCTPSAQKGPYQRLMQFLENCKNTGRLPEPKGFLHKQFWMTRNKGISYA